MELNFFLIAIILTQNIAVFLDNLGVYNLIQKHQNSKIASNYAKKYQIDFLSRGFLFFTPPLLGFLLIQNNLSLILSCFLASSLVSLLVTLIQSFFFVRQREIKYILDRSFKNTIYICLGCIIFFIHLYVPFYLNIIGHFSLENSLWIVQLSPALTSLSTAFIVYYLDPTIAKYIDSKKNTNIIFEMVLMRILGRILIVLSALILFIYF